MTPQGIKDMINNDAQRTDKKGKVIKASENTKSRLKSVFNLMYDYAVLATLVQYNPAHQFVLKGIQNKIERKRKDKVPFSPEHEAELWNDLDFGYTRMLLINIYSGWRPEELLELEKTDIDLDHMTMTGGMKTDAGFNRTIPIHPKIAGLVRKKIMGHEIVDVTDKHYTHLELDEFLMSEIQKIE